MVDQRRERASPQRGNRKSDITAHLRPDHGVAVIHFTDKCDTHDHLSLTDIEDIMRDKLTGGARSYTVQAQKGYMDFGACPKHWTRAPCAKWPASRGARVSVFSI